MLGIGEQRHREAVLRGEALVRADRLRRDPDHLGVELVEMVRCVAVGAELPRADRCEVARIEGEHDPAATVLCEPEALACGPGQLEVRGLVADLDPRHRVSVDGRYSDSTVTLSIVTT